MSAVAIQATPGLRGFDVNATVTPAMAQAFAGHGYRFAGRYVRRRTPRPSDLSAQELATLHAAGLAVAAVQHVESESSWVPFAAKGDVYGVNAAQACDEIGLAKRACVGLDLEGVADGTPHRDVIEYCRIWYEHVASAGYTPALYVGWHCGLTPEELYQLPFTVYWGAYNLDRDQFPAVRGVCVKQHAAKPDDIPPGIDCAFDVDTVAADALGGLPILCAPEGWTP